MITHRCVVYTIVKSPSSLTFVHVTPRDANQVPKNRNGPPPPFLQHTLPAQLIEHLSPSTPGRRVIFNSC